MVGSAILSALRRGELFARGRDIDEQARRDMTPNVYTQVFDGSLRSAVETASGELFTIVYKPEVALVTM